MNAKLLWLPKIIELTDFGGNFLLYQDYLYSIFKRDFIDSFPKLGRSPVFHFKEDTNGKRNIFWHLTTEIDQTNNQRNSDLRRCERLVWIRPIIKNYLEPEIFYWEKTNKKEIRSYLFIPDVNYLIILKKTKTIYYLITAYPINYENKKERFLKEAEFYNPKNAKTAL
ncbi:MAG: hypothetical protein WC705_02265 [Candidatus Paceibacterota bacterium]|jgi:hypothetical protein